MRLHSLGYQDILEGSFADIIAQPHYRLEITESISIKVHSGSAFLFSANIHIIFPTFIFQAGPQITDPLLEKERFLW